MAHLFALLAGLLEITVAPNDDDSLKESKWTTQLDELGIKYAPAGSLPKNQWRRIDIMQRQLLRSGDLQIRYRTWTTDCLVIRNFALWRGILESPKFIKTTRSTNVGNCLKENQNRRSNSFKALICSPMI